MPIIWNRTLDTGIEVIDTQHKRIVKFINDLEDVRRTKDLTRIGNVIEQLVDYTQSHFSFEESLMEEAGYKFLKPHQKVHEIFIRRVTGFTERFAKGEDVSGELHKMLCTWLLNHIANEDSDYAPIVRKMTDTEEKSESRPVVEQRRKSLLERFFGARH